MQRLERRWFLRAAALTPGAALVACRRRGEETSRSASAALCPPGYDERALSVQQQATLEAACARLIPSDDGEPGAAEAGAAGFVALQLALPQFALFKKMFVAGLRRMDAMAVKLGHTSFGAAPARAQDRILADLERGVPLDRGRTSSRFFRILLIFTLEGFLCDPVYGGNRDRAGWRLIRFEPRPPRPRCPYTGHGI